MGERAEEAREYSAPVAHAGEHAASEGGRVEEQEHGELRPVAREKRAAVDRAARLDAEQHHRVDGHRAEEHEPHSEQVKPRLKIKRSNISERMYENILVSAIQYNNCALQMFERTYSI